jgi:hypothetical protein
MLNNSTNQLHYLLRDWVAPALVWVLVMGFALALASAALALNNW